MKKIVCRSSKHDSLGCKSPNCPEGLSKQYWEKVTGFSIDILYMENGFLTIENVHGIRTKHKPFRPKLIQEIKSKNIAYNKVFKNIEQIEKYIYTVYSKHYLDIVLFEREEEIEIFNLFLDDDIRDLGIGSSIIKLISKYASDKKLRICLTPEYRGDGRFTEREWEDKSNACVQQHVSNHRNRIINFYESKGFKLLKDGSMIKT